MASAGDGERPRLPDTDDPFVLLGVERDADTRTIRQAYARLIRIYRPDRAPREFQRIHAAFEEMQRTESLGSELGKLRVERQAGAADPGDASAEPRSGQRSAATAPSGQPPSGASSDGGADLDETERARATEVARRLDEARDLAERGDRAAAAAVVSALLDERTPLDLLAATPEHAELVARHPSLSWTQLVGASSGAGAIRVVWDLAWLTAYEQDLGRAQALLDDDRLRLDAADDPRLAALCLLRIGALAWRGASVARLLDAYRAAIPPHPVLDALLASIDLDVAAVARLRHATAQAAPWIRPIRALLAADRVGDRDGRRAAARAVMTALERDVDAALRELDVVYDTFDLAPLFDAIDTQLPPGATRIAGLDKAEFARLTQALQALGHEPHKWKAVGGALGAIVLAGAIGGLGIGIAVLVGAVAAFIGTEKWRYRRGIRPGLARLLLQMPVTTTVLARWVRHKGHRARRLWLFAPVIETDRALYTLSMFTSAAISIGELDKPDQD